MTPLFERRNQANHDKDPTLNNADPAVAATPATTTTTTVPPPIATATTTTTTTMAEEEPQDLHEKEPTIQQESTDNAVVNMTQLEYESLFSNLAPSKPALTSADLFGDKSKFELESIYKATHYLLLADTTITTTTNGEQQQQSSLSDTLKGTFWYDANGDGKRGSFTNSTLHALEYDTGIGGVANIALANCETDEIVVGGGVSQPNLSNTGDATLVRRTDTNTNSNNNNNNDDHYENAGKYQFALPNIPPGRYYLVYQAPPNYRLSSNVLSLDRKDVTLTSGGKTNTFSCRPRGGEGMDFYDEAHEVGDLDYGGYCGRSVGCLEVGYLEDLRDKFEDLRGAVDDEIASAVDGTTDADTDGDAAGNNRRMAIALPTSPSHLDIGLARDSWELPVYQYASVDVTVSFPPSIKKVDVEDTLANVFASSESLGSSVHRKEVEKSVLFALNYGAAGGSGSGGAGDDGGSMANVFSVQGLDLNDAIVGSKITRKKKQTSDGTADTNADATTSSSTRYLRASHKLQEVAKQQEAAQEEEEIEEVETTEITYKLTARATYRPPPHDQLGHFVEKSINANPDALRDSLRQAKNLPALFQDVASVEGRHLTVGPTLSDVEGNNNGGGNIPDYYQRYSEDGSGNGMASWATVPVILLGCIIASLVGLLLFRRVFVRRRKVGLQGVVDGDDVVKNKKGFAMSSFGPEDDEDEKRNKKHGKRLNRRQSSRVNNQEIEDVNGDDGANQEQNPQDVVDNDEEAPSGIDDSNRDPPGHNSSDRRRRKRSTQVQTTNAESSSATSDSSSGTDGGEVDESARSGVDHSARSGVSGTSSTGNNFQDDLHALETNEARRERRHRRSKPQGDASHESSAGGSLVGQHSDDGEQQQHALSSSKSKSRRLKKKDAGAIRQSSEPVLSSSTTTDDGENTRKKRKSKASKRSESSLNVGVMS